MNQPTNTLFDIQPANPGKTCKTCRNRMVIKYGVHAYISYCTKIPTGKPGIGYKRIKAKKEACYRYENDD